MAAEAVDVATETILVGAGVIPNSLGMVGTSTSFLLLPYLPLF